MKEAVRKGEISAGHARALLAHPEPEAAMREVIARQLSVRQTEAMAARETGIRPADPNYEPRHGPDAMALERQLAEQLGLKVRVTFDGKSGMIQIYYTDLDQLDGLLKILVPSQ